jgi:hypothetical protein
VASLEKTGLSEDRIVFENVKSSHSISSWYNLDLFMSFGEKMLCSLGMSARSDNKIRSWRSGSFELVCRLGLCGYIPSCSGLSFIVRDTDTILTDP